MMKQLRILILLVLSSSYSYAQVWTIGDTIGYIRSEVSTEFLANSKVSFDLDCDGVADVSIYSAGPIDINWPWSRLSFSMGDSVKCIMLDPGYITAFSTGEVIDLSDEKIYEKHLDYICGNGQAGEYGQCSIEEKYLVFRKKVLSETYYIFISFSNFNIDFTIHHVISKCQNNPIEIVTSANEVMSNDQVIVSPNPSNHFINFSNPAQDLQIFNLNGIVVLNCDNHCEQLNISQLENGIYIMIFSYKGNQQVIKLMKN